MPERSHIRCRLCGQQLKHIGWTHLHYKHATDPQSYKEEFGLRFVTANAVRRQLSERNTPLTAAERAIIRREWRSADTTRKLAPRLSYTRDTIRKHALKMGLGFKRQKWSPERVCQVLKDRVRRGCPLRYKFLKSNETKLLGACNVHFGSVRAACEAAGVDYNLVAPPGGRKKRTAEWVISEARRLLTRPGSVRYKDVPKRLISAASREFGNWGNAKRAALK